jgi:hypothetical protein
MKTVEQMELWQLLWSAQPYVCTLKLSFDFQVALDGFLDVL